jgi:hypothetical protein
MFQLEIAALRSALGTLYNIAFNARKEHTFFPGSAPQPKGVQAIMGPTIGEPNGIPDALTRADGDTYTARTISVLSASMIILSFDAVTCSHELCRG